MNSHIADIYKMVESLELTKLSGVQKDLLDHIKARLIDHSNRVMGSLLQLDEVIKAVEKDPSKHRALKAVSEQFNIVKLSIGSSSKCLTKKLQ